MSKQNTSIFGQIQSNSALLPSGKTMAVNALTATARPVRAELLQSAGQTHISCPARVVNLAFDTIHIVFSLKYSGEVFSQLKEAKQELQRGVESETSFDFSSSGRFVWSLQRTGSKFYPYVFRSGDVIMSLSSRSEKSTIPNCTLCIGSLSSNQNPMELLKQWKRWMRLIGFHVIEEKVSRIDMCGDYKIDINETGIFQAGHRIGRVNNIHKFEHNDIFTGMQIGEGQVVCRIYDKQFEMKKKKSTEKIEFFNELWQTELTDPVTRVEFQLRREAIKELVGKQTTFKDVERSFSNVWRYLVEDWLRFTEKKVDRENKNQSKAISSEFWTVVQWSVHRRTLKAKRIRGQKHINVDGLIKQCRGIALTISAALGHHVDDFFGITKTCSNMIENAVMEFMNKPEFRKKFISKQALAVIQF